MFSSFSTYTQATINYKHLSPYVDDDTTLANNYLCPRYAESDPTSAPPSPALIEAFDILDNIPWRRSYVSLDEGESREHACQVLRMRWRTNKAYIIALLFLFILLVIGCIISLHVAIMHERTTMTRKCYTRGGGDKCKQPPWAKCLARSGLGYCEGVM